MILKLAQIGNSDSTINRKVSCLSTMLRYALMHQYIPSLPHIPKKKEPEHRIRWITEKEQDELLAFFQYIGQEDMEDIIKVSLDTGARRGELLRIQARDIHNQQLHIWESKSGKSRTVPLTNRAAAVLGKRANITEHPTDKLFAGWTGDGIRHYWDRARQHMGLVRDPQFVPHVMRHTFCSLLAMKGVPIPAIKELAGHSSIVTTQRYVHMSPASLSDAIGLLEKDTRFR
jgi:integrase